MIARMGALSKVDCAMPPEQQAIRARCFHPSGTFVEFPKEDVEKSIPERFEKIVLTYADRIAVKTKERQFTYQELNKQANRLAHYLLARRGAVQEPIALFLDHWDTLLIAHLAVLKAGKFSLGLDPKADVARTAHLLNDSGARVVIVDKDTDETVRGLAGKDARVIDVDDLGPSLSEKNPGIHIAAEAYAYIRYTSGSTAKAKGVTKTHRHILKAVRDFANDFHLCSDDRVTLLGFASIGKHAFKALLTGARLCPFDARREALAYLADWLVREEITVYYSFPTAFRNFVSTLSGTETFPHLRLIEMEGEPVYASDVELLKQHFSSRCIMVNTLSSAETGTVCLYFVDRTSTVSDEGVPVGYPMQDVEVLLLDDAGEPVGLGQVGEVAVRSRFLSSGYWQKPDVTSKKFISQSDDGADCLYLTGDLGRMSHDGCLKLLGRKDFQVKIRSFRVDVAEVEAVLATHPDLKSAAVIGRNDEIENTKLVAYVVPKSYPPPSVPGLRSYLEQKLPDYMIPADFVFLDELPLLSTGKIDRRALPDPGNQRPDMGIPVVAPRTPIEKEVAKIWAEVLSLAEVGIHDNFLHLGGHSLAAARVISRVFEIFQLELPLKALFESPTVAEMAKIIASNETKKAGQEALARMLSEVEALSEEQVQQSLAEEARDAAEPTNMSDSTAYKISLPAGQQAIRAKCFHPSGRFVEFRKEEIEQSIPERFAKTVREYPNHLAIKSGNQSLTYEELHRNAKRIACAIIEKCGEGNRPVAILLEHGALVLTAILGTLKAGKICLPLDPSYPVERLHYMLRDAGAELVLAQNDTALLARTIGRQEFQVMNVDDISECGANDDLDVQIPPDAFAYILYTSGSTGQPKGVVDNHRNLLHGTLRFTNGLHICAEDRISLTHSCSSSASLRRIFPALLNGASLFPLDIRREGMQRLLKLLVEESITVFSTGRIRDFIRNLDTTQTFSSLRLVSLGGEVVQWRDVDLYRRIFPPHCVIGIWMSSTEAGNITQFLIDRETRITGDIAPVGYPAEDLTVLLVDDAGKQVETGAIGEIAVKSRYLACGYWRRAELSNEKFRPDPDGGAERFYLTGDLGRVDSDGCLFHLGRKDDQVKVRGHRVEVVEVEAALMSLGYFRKTFVTLRDRGPGEKSLIAYLVTGIRPVPTTSALRTALAATLPNHMIPTVFVMLDSLPLTPTGKVDRNALPDPGNSRPELDTPLVKPRTAVESELSKVWCEVLGLAQVGIHDNFFELGGHSLGASRVISRVIQTFQLELPLKALFDSPTVAEMAKIIALNQAKTASHEDLDRMLKEVEAMSEERAQELVNEEITRSDKPAERE